jgi:hypothetical protein
MAETLGSLCDKLTIVKLKQWHSEEETKKRSLEGQEKQLLEEMNSFIAEAVAGRIPPERLTFAANKVYRKEGNVVDEVRGDIGEIFAKLADVNCRLWHVQERVYDFEDVPMDQKDAIVKQLALLNLERNQCIDRLDSTFREFLEGKRIPAR